MFNVIEKAFEEGSKDSNGNLHGDFVLYEQFSNEKSSFANSYKKSFLSRVKEGLEMHKNIKDLIDKAEADRLAEIEKKLAEEAKKREKEERRLRAE